MQELFTQHALKHVSIVAERLKCRLFTFAGIAEVIFKSLTAYSATVLTPFDSAVEEYDIPVKIVPSLRRAKLQIKAGDNGSQFPNRRKQTISGFGFQQTKPLQERDFPFFPTFNRVFPGNPEVVNAIFQENPEQAFGLNNVLVSLFVWSFWPLRDDQLVQGISFRGGNRNINARTMKDCRMCRLMNQIIEKAQGVRIGRERG